MGKKTGDCENPQSPNTTKDPLFHTGGSLIFNLLALPLRLLRAANKLE